MPPKRGYKKKKAVRRTYTRFPRVVSVVEKKFFDFILDKGSSADNIFTSTWAQINIVDGTAKTLVGLIVQGTGNSNRLGRSIWIHSISLQILVEKAALLATSNAARFRLALVLDKQANGAEAGATAIWTPTNIYGFRVLQNAKRFTILKMVQGTMNATAYSGTTATDQARSVNIYHKFKTPLRIDYTDTGNGVADLTENNLGVWIVEDVALGTPVLTMANESTGRIRFSDNPGY